MRHNIYVQFFTEAHLLSLISQAQLIECSLALLFALCHRGIANQWRFCDHLHVKLMASRRLPVAPADGGDGLVITSSSLNAFSLSYLPSLVFIWGGALDCLCVCVCQEG